MPRLKVTPPKYPPVDKLKAVMLERKLVMKLDYKAMADAAHCTPEHMRKLMTTKHTEDWPPEVRRSICRMMGLNVKTIIDQLFEIS